MNRHRGRTNRSCSDCRHCGSITSPADYFRLALHSSSLLRHIKMCLFPRTSSPRWFREGETECWEPTPSFVDQCCSPLNTPAHGFSKDRLKLRLAPVQSDEGCISGNTKKKEEYQNPAGSTFLRKP